MLNVLAFGLAISGAQESLIHQTFENGTEGWYLTGKPAPDSKVSVTREAAHLKTGSASLQLDYSVAKDETSVFSLPLEDGALAKAKSLKFWMQPDHTTAILVVLQEKGGGSYVARASATKDQWQRVELAPSDFVLGTSPTDPKDPDGKLDMDLVSAISFVDFGEFLIQGDPKIAALFNVAPGPRTLYVSDFVADSAALPEASGRKLIDAMNRPQAQWIPIGHASLSIASSGPVHGPSLKLVYHVDAGGLAGAIRGVASGDLTGAKEIDFPVACDKPAKLMVQLEEIGGGKYNTMLEIPGGSAAKDISVAFADLTPASDSKDSNDKLDPDQINQILILDVGGMVDQTASDNSVWIGKIVAK